LVFNLPASIMPECNRGDDKRPVIGVGIKDYYGVLGQRNGVGEAKYAGFINKLGTFVLWLIKHDYVVRLLVGDSLYDSRAKKDLMDALEKQGLEAKDGQLINEPIRSLEELLVQLAACDIVVSPRYHNIILTLMLNKPAVSLSYHEKFTALMEGVGLAEYCQDIDDLDINKLIEQVKDLEKNADELKPYIKKRTEEYRRVLDRQYSVIFNNIWVK
jgi:polysaccharide pyruvyl transferase WcaK-like protein